MFCHLKYKLDKELLRKHFFENFSKAMHHKTAKSEIKFWYKMFYENEVTEPIIQELNLKDLDIIPRFSYQLKNTRLPLHIDIDRIVGINLNLLDTPVTIHINGRPYEYEAALIDVGTKLHSVEPISNDRLVLKLAIRNSWEEVYSRLKSADLLKTFNDTYVSILPESQKHLVRL